MAFTDQNLVTGNQLKKQLDAINGAQAKTAVGTNKARIVLIDATGATILTADDLITALGQAAYDSECADAVTALNTALSAAETTAQAAFTALGS